MAVDGTPIAPLFFGFNSEAATFVGGSTVTYTMRGFDQDGGVDDYVTWQSAEVDADASEYTGPGPVVDVVIMGVTT